MGVDCGVATSRELVGEKEKEKEKVLINLPARLWLVMPLGNSGNGNSTLNDSWNVKVGSLCERGFYDLCNS